MELCGCFSKSSRGRIWQPGSVMDWNVRSAYGERREKARGTAKPELSFETPWKLGWWLNKAFSPPKVQQKQQKIWTENKPFFFFGQKIITFSLFTLGDCYFSQQDFSLSWRNNESAKPFPKQPNPFLMLPTQILGLLCQPARTDLARGTMSPVPCSLFPPKAFFPLELSYLIWQKLCMRIKHPETWVMIAESDVLHGAGLK